MPCCAACLPEYAGRGHVRSCCPAAKHVNLPCSACLPQSRPLIQGFVQSQQHQHADKAPCAPLFMAGTKHHSPDTRMLLSACSIITGTLATWLRAALGASRDMLDRVLDHLARHASPGLYPTLLQLLQHAQGSGDPQLAAGVLALLAHMQASSAQANALLVHHGFLDLSQRQLLTCSTDALAGDPLALAALLSTLTILQGLAATAAAELAGHGWCPAVQAAEPGQVLGRVGGQVALLAAKWLEPPGAVGSLLGHAVGCALLVAVLNVAGLVAATVRSRCHHECVGHAGQDSQPEPGPIRATHIGIAYTLQNLDRFIQCPACVASVLSQFVCECKA